VRWGEIITSLFFITLATRVLIFLSGFIERIFFSRTTQSCTMLKRLQQAHDALEILGHLVDGLSCEHEKRHLTAGFC
jgi:hypothetical protein